jgi:hypothetical protein
MGPISIKIRPLKRGALCARESVILSLSEPSAVSAGHHLFGPGLSEIWRTSSVEKPFLDVLSLPGLLYAAKETLVYSMLVDPVLQPTIEGFLHFYSRVTLGKPRLVRKPLISMDNISRLTQKRY